MQNRNLNYFFVYCISFFTYTLLLFLIIFIRNKTRISIISLSAVRQVCLLFCIIYYSLFLQTGISFHKDRLQPVFHADRLQPVSTSYLSPTLRANSELHLLLFFHRDLILYLQLYFLQFAGLILIAVAKL